MKYLIPLMLLIALPALGEEMPDGCYVADYYRTDPCWNASDNVTSWTSYTDRYAGVYHYGSAIESVIYYGAQYRNKYQACTTDYNNLVTISNTCSTNYTALNDQYNSLSSQYSSNEINHVNAYNLLVNQFNASLSLAKKLRKACGVKCKKIK